MTDPRADLAAAIGRAAVDAMEAIPYERDDYSGENTWRIVGSAILAAGWTPPTTDAPFYEDDEPVEKVLAAFNRGEKNWTTAGRPPTTDDGRETFGQQLAAINATGRPAPPYRANPDDDGPFDNAMLTHPQDSPQTLEGKPRSAGEPDLVRAALIALVHAVNVVGDGDRYWPRDMRLEGTHLAVEAALDAAAEALGTADPDDEPVDP